MMTCQAKYVTGAKLITGLRIAAVLGVIFTRTGITPGIAQDSAAESIAGTSTAGISAAPGAEKKSDGPSKANESTDGVDRLLQDLEIARTSAAGLGSYTAVLEMQEELNGRLTEPEMVDIKFRTNPFSVYMFWRSNSQEAIFVSGQNDAKVLVRPAGGLAAIKRLWRLDPDSRLAKQSSRYPVTDAGLLKLTERVQSFYKDEMSTAADPHCSISETSIQNHDYREYTVHFPSREACEKYSACHYRFDMESRLLLLVENFGWSDQGDEGDHPLVEKYRYDSIDTGTSLSETDFDHRNPEYDFVARSN